MGGKLKPIGELPQYHSHTHFLQHGNACIATYFMRHGTQPFNSILH